MFRTFVPQHIVLGDISSILARQKENITVEVQLWNEPDPEATVRTITIKVVLYVPGLKANLLSCSSFCIAGYDIKLKGNNCRAMPDR